MKRVNRRSFLLSVFCSLILLLPGCAVLDKSGPYGGDTLLFNADQTITAGYSTLRTFVKWEKDNRDALAAWPEVRKSADHVRLNAQRWIDSAIALRERYAANKTQANRNALTDGLRVIRTAMTEATKYLNQHEPAPGN